MPARRIMVLYTAALSAGDQAREAAGRPPVAALTASPTIKTTITPRGFCHRKEMPLVAGCRANVATLAMPASSPTKAPWPLVRRNTSASTNTPSSDP